MKKKKWYRSVSMKGNLLVLQYLLLGAVLFCGVMFVSLQMQGLRVSDSGKEYVDSQAFANKFYGASMDVAHAISGDICLWGALRKILMNKRQLP